MRKKVLKSLVIVFLSALASSCGSGKNGVKATGAASTGKYNNKLKEVGYTTADIDAKLAKTYYDLFEGPNKIYFEVGDSLAYISDIKNHDART